MQRRRPSSSLLSDELTRRLLALAASLLVLNAAVRLPIYPLPPDDRIGWLRHLDREVIEVDDYALEALARPTRHAPPAAVEVIDADGEGEDDESAELVLQEEIREAPHAEFARAAVLDFSEIAPAIVGGMRAFYINIEYPAAARDAGVQGRLVLDFIVEPDGRPTQIQVLQSLHPLCDSAAVDALRATRFMPGRHNGEEVRVRMRLPVRFQLIEQQADASL